jgi:hypothetical protein
MVNDINNYFVTFKVFKNSELIQETQCPKSMLQIFYTAWVYPDTPYSVEVIDENGVKRINSVIQTFAPK